jgi:glycosyltransferase involved in cell wall biosynthesis
VSKIDVIIPAYNAADHIEECLEKVFDSDYDDFSVTVADDHSADGTLQKVARFPRAKVIASPKNLGASAMRNLGIDQTSGDIIVFIDSDVLIPRDMLRALADRLRAQPRVSAVQARYGDEPYYGNLYSRYKHYVFSFRGINPMRDGEVYANYVHTACVAIRREVGLAFRFDENIHRGEDIDFGQRLHQAGLLILPDAGLCVGHKKKYTFASFCRYQFRSAIDMAGQALGGKRAPKGGKPFYSAKNPLYKKLWLLRPAVSGLALLNLGWLAFAPSPAAWACLAAIVAVSFTLEHRFRLYLWKVAPWWASLMAFPLYFHDGLLLAAGTSYSLISRALGRRG